MAARARNTPLLGDGELQQLAERRGAGVMHGRTQGHLRSLQIEMARLAALLENQMQELFYFARDLLTDGFGRFFSCGESVSSNGRARQICAFTSTKARLNSR